MKVNDLGYSLGATDNYVRDTPTYRKGTIEQLKLWNEQSTSNPFEGIKNSFKKIQSLINRFSFSLEYKFTITNFNLLPNRPING